MIECRAGPEERRAAAVRRTVNVDQPAERFVKSEGAEGVPAQGLINAQQRQGRRHAEKRRQDGGGRARRLRHDGGRDPAENGQTAEAQKKNRAGRGGG